MTLARAVLKRLLFVAYLGLATSLLLFTLIEVVPGLLGVINLDAIRYYAQKRESVADDQLVHRARVPDFTVDSVFNGDQYAIDPELARQVPPLALKYTATYKGGFRANSSSAPFDMVILGDSFLEIGESDGSTFSELVARRSGLATFNLGRGGYGPYQYQILLAEYLKLRPRYAVVCFFAGNDMADVRNYDDFLAGGDYGSHLRERSFFARYAIAASDTFVALQKALRERIVPGLKGLARDARSAMRGVREPEQGPGRIRDYIGAIRLNDRAIPMRFSYWNPKQSADELLNEKEWQSLKRVLAEMKSVTARHHVELVIVYIPSKLQVYGRHFVERESGAGFLRRIPDQLRYETNTLEAFTAVTKELGLEFVDLDTHFKRLAAEGELLFYPFDTHWNARGRELAADLLARHLSAAAKPAPARGPHTVSERPPSR
jgi:hypothetical protein